MEISKLIIFVILTIVFCGIPNVSGRPEFENFFENKQSKYVMGKREPGDELIIKDELRNSLSDDKQSVDKYVKFEYPVNNKIITYIELGSDSNVRFEFSLGITGEEDGGYLTGTVTALEPVFFFVKISVYGVERSDATKYLESFLVPKFVFQSKPEPRPIEDEYMDEIEDNDDTVIILGDRQEGDHLLYKDKRGSGVSNYRSEHNVTFYYNDENFVTCAIFRSATKSKKDTIYYSRVSPHSFKAVLKDHNVFEMNAYMEVYGYEPHEKPDTYKPLLSDSAIDPLLEGVKFQKLSDDIEVIESIADNILAPVNLCSTGSKTTIIMILNFLCALTLLISQC